MAYITFQPSDYFNTKLYTGTGSTNAQTGLGFRPDWVWMKRRDSSGSHRLCDVVRGATKLLQSNASDAEQTGADTLTSFDSDGFTLGADAAPYNVNVSGQTMVAWCWRAGNSQGSSNTDGTINTTYTSVNTTSGFSISQYGGNGTQFATVGHGLGVAPNVIMIKNLSSATGWIVYHDKAGLTGSTLDGEAEYKMLSLNGTGAASDNNNDVIWGSTSTRYKIDATGSATYLNSSGSNYVAYCFAEKKGFSKFGSYSGNGNVNGPFIYTGFKPQFVITKRTDSANGWIVMDSKRSPINVMDDLMEVQSNGGDATASSYKVDYLSNGFKIRNTNNVFNNSSGSYVYMAFAEEPLVSSNNIPATAR